jgi:hypothetical protein
MIPSETLRIETPRIDMPHCVLLGDSAFDNAAYVSGGPHVLAHLRHALPPNWRASLSAVDGGIMASIPRQLASMPADATHLVLSVGGNDALRHSPVLAEASASVAESVLKLADVTQQFHSEYAATLDAVLLAARPTVVCTIYDPRYENSQQRRVVTTALALLNDVIIREAARRGMPLLDLRWICGDDADFANPIEPSVQGGRKIAQAIASIVTQHDFADARSVIFAG